MKVRHKKFRIKLELADPQPFLPHWWKTIGGSCIAYNDPEWELVNEDKWEDVTGECTASETTNGGEICIVHGSNRVERHAGIFKSYRFTKIDGLHNGPAFIVERKKS